MDAPPSSGLVIAGKYRLDRALARGGMGSVWVALHLGLDVPVAIKFMNVALSSLDEALVRFEREAKLSARIRSPHVVEVLDYGTDQGRPYIVMELLLGEHLGERLRREGRLWLPDAAAIVLQVAKALHCAHEAGVIHRDLKPANVFLSRVGDEEIVKLLDFGIAKAGWDEDCEVTRTGVVLGSPSYMSPEQVRGIKYIDHRSDLWSLGVLLYRALTGKMPFQGESNLDVALRIAGEPCPPATSVVPDLPPEVDELLGRALARDREHRFQSAREMAAAIASLTARLGLALEPPLSSHPHPLPLQTRVAFEPASELAPGSLRFPPSRPASGPGSEAPPSLYRPELPDVRAPQPSSRPAASLRALPGGAGRGEDTSSQGSALSLATPGRPRRSGTMPRAAAPRAVATLIDEGFDALRAGDHQGAERCWRTALELDPENRLLQLNLQKLAALGAHRLAGAR
jgi:eukaryotic-like serine/threonine-protein kinase